MPSLVDIHCHLLPGVDDGSRTVEQSVEVEDAIGSVAPENTGKIARRDRDSAERKPQILITDPSLDAGTVGLREGPITAATDSVSVRLRGHGGHTSRPHLTQDLTFALAKVVTDVPGALSRRLDPRAGASLVWGRVSAGSAANVIPAYGEVAGTLRVLDIRAWTTGASPLPWASLIRPERVASTRPRGTACLSGTAISSAAGPANGSRSAWVLIRPSRSGRRPRSGGRPQRPVPRTRGDRLAAGAPAHGH